MKKFLITLLLCIICICGYSISTPSEVSWEGNWEHIDYGRRPVYELPFHSEIFNDLFIINNELPDRDIHYMVIDECGTILKEGNVNKENSSQITIYIGDLKISTIYTIVLTSANLSDKTFCTFMK